MKKKKTLYIYTDGGARPNPGHAGIGVVIYDAERTMHEISKYIGEATSNEAEYLAIIHALIETIEMNRYDEVMLFSDSLLVVQQLNHKYKIRNENLKKYADIVFNLIDKIGNVSIHKISRSLNEKADKLAGKAIYTEMTKVD